LDVQQIPRPGAHTQPSQVNSITMLFSFVFKIGINFWIPILIIWTLAQEHNIMRLKYLKGPWILLFYIRPFSPEPWKKTIKGFFSWYLQECARHTHCVLNNSIFIFPLTTDLKGSCCK
jgi:hypothetical protein